MLILRPRMLYRPRFLCRLRMRVRLTLGGDVSDVLPSRKAAVDGVARGAGREHAHLLERVCHGRQDEKTCREHVRDDLEPISSRVEEAVFRMAGTGVEGGAETEARGERERGGGAGGFNTLQTLCSVTTNENITKCAY